MFAKWGGEGGGRFSWTHHPPPQFKNVTNKSEPLGKKAALALFLLATFYDHNNQV